MTTATTAGETPAILGGAAAIDLQQDAAHRWPLITGDDERAVLEVLRSGELAISPVVAALEDDYRNWLGVRHAVAHCNGTTAIHCALHALGVGPGDEVLVPSATWWASVMPVLHCGATPVFVETEPECMGLDPDDVAARITDRTKAMVVVHLFGLPSKMDELRRLAGTHGLKILEDASHAHGAVYHARPAGTLGDVAVLSMQANKLCPSAEGGMLVTDDDAIHEQVLTWGHYERLLPLKQSPQRRFAATGFGIKARMSPLSAAVARVQLGHLAQRNARRNESCRYLSDHLETLGIHTYLPPAGIERVYFEFLVSCREDVTGVPVEVLARALQAEGALVGAPRYPLLHQQPVFTEGTWAEIARIPADRVYDPADLPRTTAGNRTLLKLPSFPNADRPLLDQYRRAFDKVINHASKLPRDA